MELASCPNYYHITSIYGSTSEMMSVQFNHKDLIKLSLDLLETIEIWKFKAANWLQIADSKHCGTRVVSSPTARWNPTMRSGQGGEDEEYGPVRIYKIKYEVPFKRSQVPTSFP